MEGSNAQSVFLTISKQDWICESEYFFAIRDKFPVSPGHTLIISKELINDFFELSEAQSEDMFSFIKHCKTQLDVEFKPHAYNIGMNCGEVAGQTVMHFHCHLIPRFLGDMEDPRGGIRHCVSGKGYYKND